MAVTQFTTVSGQCGFEYQWFFTANGTVPFGVNLISSWTVNSWCGFATVKSTIFYMMTWKCNGPYFYFNLSSNMCQDMCGSYYFGNTTTYTCDPCIDTTCYSCNTSTSLCITCEAILNRILINGTCVCVDGYFENNGLCLPCSSGNTGCNNCTYNDGTTNGSLPFNVINFTCTSCDNTTNFINPSTHLCAPCSMTGCLTCSAYQLCSTCNTSLQYFLNPSTNTCWQCSLSYCLSCVDYNMCGTCNSSAGAFLTGKSTCSTCQVIGCLTCQTGSNSKCKVCDTANGYGLIGDLCFLCS